MRTAVVLGKPFDFRNGLPTQLVLAKPVEQGNYDPAVLTSRPGGFPLIATRKWNGHRIIATFVPGRRGEEQTIRLFGDGIHKDGTRKRVDLHLPHVVADLQRLGIPPWTVLSTEAVAERGGVERLGAVGSILQMKNPVEAIGKQEHEGRAKLILHGALCWDDEWLNDTPYDQVLAKLVGVAPPNRVGIWVEAVAAQRGTLEEAIRRVRDNDWEGLVVTRHDYRFTWRLDGPEAENPRPDGCYKWKPQLTGDFIADEPRMSTTRKGRLKDVMLTQIAPDGRQFRCGRLGNFSAAVDGELQRRGFPAVLEVLFDGRTPTGKLVSPRFVRVRDDKLVLQCVCGKSFPIAEYV